MQRNGTLPPRGGMTRVLTRLDLPLLPGSVHGPSRRWRCREGALDEGVDHPLLEGTDFCGREPGDVAQPDAGLDATCGAECQCKPVDGFVADRVGHGRERLEEPWNGAALAQRQLVRHLAQREAQHRTLLRLILLHAADDE